MFCLILMIIVDLNNELTHFSKKSLYLSTPHVRIYQYIGITKQIADFTFQLNFF